MPVVQGMMIQNKLKSIASDKMQDRFRTQKIHRYDNEFENYIHSLAQFDSNQGSSNEDVFKKRYEHKNLRNKQFMQKYSSKDFDLVNE